MAHAMPRPMGNSGASESERRAWCERVEVKSHSFETLWQRVSGGAGLQLRREG
jgi:hypothetical protein